MNRYTLKERLIILSVVMNYVNNDSFLIEKTRNGNKNEFTLEIIRQLRKYNELNCRTNGALLCQISTCVVGIYLNDGRKWSKNSTSNKYSELLKKLDEEF